MALINTLRNKMGKVIIGVVAFAIVSFTLADILGPNSTLLSGNDDVLGEIAGEEIKTEQYQQKIKEMERNYGGNLNENQRASVRNTAWDALIAEIAFQKEFNDVGLQVTNDELVDMVQGKNINPGIRQQFTNPETGEFDRDQVIAALKNIAQLPANQRTQWQNYENTLKSGRLRVKYDNLLVLSTYVTSEEAKKEYEYQTAIAEAKYLYVPYYSVNDSLIGDVTDNDLQAYLDSHESDYEVEEGRSVAYVNFEVKPSSQDTIAFNEEMDRVKQDLQNAKDDSVFARINTESQSNNFYRKYNIGELPVIFQSDVEGMVEGEVRGPILENGKYNLYKVSKINSDTTYSAKARHILFSFDGDSDETKAKAKAEAQKILGEIRQGADFAEMAKLHSKDGSAANGGELPWAIKGQTWTPEFEEPVFEATETGLINKLIESPYGFHIIDVLETPTNQTYSIAIIETEMIPSEETGTDIYRKADLFAYNANTYDEFTKNASQDSLVVLNAQKLDKNARSINNLTNAREVVRWLYNEADINEVSKVIELENSYVVAVLTGITEEGIASVADVKNELTVKVKNERKSDYIISKIKGLNGTLDEISNSYGSDANVYSTSDLKFNSNSLPSVGFAPYAIGKAFSLDPGQVSEPFETDNGILMIELINFTAAPEIADYTTYKDQKKQSESSKTSVNINTAIREFANVKDKRYKAY